MPEIVWYFFCKICVGQFQVGTSVAFCLCCNSATSPAGISNFTLPLRLPTEAALAGHLLNFFKVSAGSGFLLFGCQYCCCDTRTTGKMPDLPWGNSQSQTKSLWKPYIHLSAIAVLEPGLSQIKIWICWISAKNPNMQDSLSGNFCANAMYCNTAVQEDHHGYYYKERAQEKPQMA